MELQKSGNFFELKFLCVRSVVQVFVGSFFDSFLSKRLGCLLGKVTFFVEKCVNIVVVF